MTKSTSWEVSIEYGPTAADVHYVTVDAESMEDALKKAGQWAADNGMRNVMVCNATDMGDMSDVEDDFTDVIEWTTEEEEEFIRIIDSKGDEE
jgi:hypothetical protein